MPDYLHHRCWWLISKLTKTQLRNMLFDPRKKKRKKVRPERDSNSQLVELPAIPHPVTPPLFSSPLVGSNLTIHSACNMQHATTSANMPSKL